MRACRTRPFSISHMMSVSRSADIRFRNLDLRPRSIFRMSVRIESDCIKPRKPPRCAPVMPATARILRAKVQPYRVQHRRSCMRCVARAGARPLGWRWAALGRRAPHASTRASDHRTRDAHRAPRALRPRALLHPRAASAAVTSITACRLIPRNAASGAAGRSAIVRKQGKPPISSRVG